MYENPLRNVSRCVFRGRKSGALSAGAAADRRKETGMAKKKYRDDYRLTERIDDRGRTRRDIEYIGGHYRYILAPAALRRDRRSVLAVCCVLCPDGLLQPGFHRTAEAAVVRLDCHDPGAGAVAPDV